MTASPPNDSERRFEQLIEDAEEEGITGFRAPRGERAAIDAEAGEGAARYGEITVAGARRLLRWLQLGPRDQFFDLGSGAGRLVLQAAACSEVGTAIGIELSPWRHECAGRLLDRLCVDLEPEAAQALRSRVAFARDDIRSADVSRATAVYIGATCFPTELLHATARHLLATAPQLHTLMSTQPLSEIHATSWVQRGQVDVAMSWSNSEPVFVYAPAADRGTAEQIDVTPR